MTLEYLDAKIPNPLITEFFHLRFETEDLPFQSTILPICSTTLTSTYKNNHHFVFKEEQTVINDLIVTGQFYESYQFLVREKGHSFGITLHPTALYKLTGLNIYKIKNKHIPLRDFSKELYAELHPIFFAYENDMQKLTQNLNDVISKLPLTKNANTSKIDKVIDIIHTKEGLLNTYDLLEHIDFSQKTLETHFKKIVGLTPGRYIRLYRFLKLMRKYESKEIELKDLIHMYNYYDHSHFAKDFKHFMKQTPKDYFKSDHPLLNLYLNK